MLLAGGALRYDDFCVEHLHGQLAGKGFGLFQVLQYGYDAAQVVELDEVGRPDGLSAPAHG
ncbi:hypothetical protein DDJ31_39405 [Streptomyces griseoviridis]|uniref:Uncharacterized protein n=1 Tax=Streptomyces griseoviridis TaxID=45398 RepID=A0ABX5U563_STRGD|nr:hypothetical protein DDJ31_39405 [Streptomyces griseoviridis]